MNQYKRLFSITMIGIFFLALSACSENSKNATKNVDKGIHVKMTNPVVYFEFKFENQMIDHNEMALFPFVEANSGISGALAKGAIYKPTNCLVFILSLGFVRGMTTSLGST